jgi:hypothetical protein
VPSIRPATASANKLRFLFRSLFRSWKDRV